MDAGPVGSADGVDTPDGLDQLEALRALVRNSTDMLARHAPDGTYRYVSPACRELLGYEPAQLVGRSAYDLFHPEDLEAIVASHRRVLEVPELSTAEYRIRHADGHWVWFQTTGHTIRDRGTGEVLEIQTSSRDITARKVAEDRLQASERQFRLAMRSAPIGMALVGLDGSWVEVNEQLCSLVGRTRDELQTLTFQDITHPDDLDLDLEYMQQLLAGERDHYSMEKRYIHADGHVVWILLHGAVVRDEDGTPVHFIAQIEDVSHRRRREQELRDLNERLALSNAELERFALVASHDLRSPLAAVVGFLELVPRFADELPPSALDALAGASRNVHRSLETVDALLQLARVGRRGEQMAVDVGEVVAEVQDLLAGDLADSGAELVVGELPTVLADPSHVRVLFQNLVANAIKYREPERALRIEVTAHDDGDRWTLVVSDNGRGFAPEDREVIFAPFSRRSTGEKVEGVGIGLATCRRIVSHHGGKIAAEPLEPGARFTFTLPAVDEAGRGGVAGPRSA